MALNITSTADALLVSLSPRVPLQVALCLVPRPQPPSGHCLCNTTLPRSRWQEGEGPGGSVPGGTQAGGQPSRMERGSGGGPGANWLPELPLFSPSPPTPCCAVPPEGAYVWLVPPEALQQHGPGPYLISAQVTPVSQDRRGLSISVVSTGCYYWAGQHQAWQSNGCRVRLRQPLEPPEWRGAPHSACGPGQVRHGSLSSVGPEGGSP